jgi:hypothetical protein
MMPAGTQTLRLAMWASLLLSCSSIEAVRLQPETVDVGPGLRPVAGIQARATSLYVLFVGIPGVDLDKVVNQMLVASAKSMGADKVTAVTFEIDPDSGVWSLWKLFGWRTAVARGIAVQVVTPPTEASTDPSAQPVTKKTSRVAKGP